ncbi:MAG: hypothetical protein IT356_08485 [Gemmatimonadaceae bacterium]|nr:hypothetical protein [Gemmatimonadaceae bacterium]
MSKRSRRNHAPEYKAKVALAAVKGEATLENDFSDHAHQGRVAERQAMSDRTHALHLNFPFAGASMLRRRA